MLNTQTSPLNGKTRECIHHLKLERITETTQMNKYIKLQQWLIFLGVNIWIIVIWISYIIIFSVILLFSLWDIPLRMTLYFLGFFNIQLQEKNSILYPKASERNLCLKRGQDIPWWNVIGQNQCRSQSEAQHCTGKCQVWVVQKTWAALFLPSSDCRPVQGL